MSSPPNGEAYVPSKVVEHLAASLPIVSSLRGNVEQLLRDNRCGDVSALAEVLKKLDADGAGLAAMSRNARGVFDTMLRVEKVYGDIIASLHEVATLGSLNWDDTKPKAPASSLWAG